MNFAKKRLILALFGVFLGGCAPYVEVGAGYALDSGRYGFDERCAVGHVAVGLERGDWSVEFMHQSCLAEKPELAPNHVIVKRRFGGER